MNSVLDGKAGGATPVSVMVFTLNEEVNLPGCLASLAWCDDVIVVDSYSIDCTLDIARAAGARVVQHSFTGFGDQRNWALANSAPRHEWILILDADERVPSELARELAMVPGNVPESVAAYRVRRRFHMWGHWLRYSSLYPSWVVRLVRAGRVKYVNRGHAETQMVRGEICDLAHDLIDENLKGIDEWFERQNRYSSREAEYELAEENLRPSLLQVFSGDPLVRRACTKRIGASIPGRCVWYFLYSYVIRGGFRDGYDGLIFCLMRSVYQAMISAKKHDLRRAQVRR